MATIDEQEAAALSRLEKCRTNTPGRTINNLASLLKQQGDNPIRAELVDLINKHVDSTELDIFKYSKLNILWSTTLTNPYACKDILLSRFHATNSLARFGVSFSLNHNKISNRVTLYAEDLKGRHVPLVVLDNQEAKPYKIENKGTHHYYRSFVEPNVDGNIQFIHPSLNESGAKDEMLRIFNRAVLFTEHVEDLDQHKDFFFCKKEGVKFPGCDEPKIPILVNTNHNSTPAQFNKIEPGFLKKVSNALRYGPSYETIKKTFNSLMDEVNGSILDPIDTAKSLERELAKITKKTNKVNDITQQRMVSILDNITGNSTQRELALVSLFINSAGAIKFNPNDGAKLKHTPIDFVERKATKNGNANPTPKPERAPNKTNKATPKSRTQPDITPPKGALAIFEQYHEDLTAEQLSRKLIEELSTSGSLLPLSVDEIKTINTFVETMKNMPTTAASGLNWLADIVKEKEMSLLEVEAPSHRKNQTPAIDDKPRIKM